MGAPVPRPSALDAVAWGAMLVFGMVAALLGAAIPTLSARLSFGLDDAGTLFLAMNAAMLAASLLVGPAADRLGMKGPLVAGAALVALALAGIGRASGFGGLLAAFAALGLGGGALNAAANTLTADVHEDPAVKASALNLLGMVYGFGALLLPFSFGALLSSVGLGGLLGAGAALCLALALAAAVLRFPAPKQNHGWPLAGMHRFLGVPLVVALAILLFFESGVEFVLGGYFSSFLNRELSVPVAHASYLLAAYWAAIMVSRLLVSRVLLGASPHGVVLGGAVLAAAGAVVVSVAPSMPAAVAGIVITGLALAGIFPTVLGIAGTAFRAHSGTVFGILFTVALTGGMTLPWLSGHLAESAGLRPVFLLVAACFAVIAGLSVVARRARAH